MSLFWLNPDSYDFPPANLADDDGMLAIGGDYHPQRILSAYAQGIFPWTRFRGAPVWFSPDPRMVLLPASLHIPRSLAKIIRRGDYDIRFDTRLADVIQGCADISRPGQDGTWINPDYTEGFLRLGALGYAHSVEAYQDGELVGGVYGLAIGQVFFGESMFARAPDASKVAFATLVRELLARQFTLIDCQDQTEHLARFGAETWRRARFLDALHTAIPKPYHPGPWRSSLPPWDGRKDAWPFASKSATT